MSGAGDQIRTGDPHLGNSETLFSQDHVSTRKAEVTEDDIRELSLQAAHRFLVGLACRAKTIHIELRFAVSPTAR